LHCESLDSPERLTVPFILTLQDVRKKVARVVAAKCTLAARVDSFHESPEGEVGEDLREQVQRKIDKILEPPPVKAAKPLPRPDDAPRKKRGGRRVRKMKERYAITEIRKQANRMTFGSIQEDAYQDDLGFDAGQLGRGGVSGPVRAPTADKKTQVSISKRLQVLQSRKAYCQVWLGTLYSNGTLNAIH
jgi:U4/U6 small nuclear ribonucleoprotein PRP31